MYLCSIYCFVFSTNVNIAIFPNLSLSLHITMFLISFCAFLVSVITKTCLKPYHKITQPSLCLTTYLDSKSMKVFEGFFELCITYRPGLIAKVIFLNNDRLPLLQSGTASDYDVPVPRNNAVELVHFLLSMCQ